MVHTMPFDSAGSAEQYKPTFEPLSKIIYQALGHMEHGGSVHIVNRRLTTMGYPSEWWYVKNPKYEMWLEYFAGQQKVNSDNRAQYLLHPRSNVVARITTRMRNANAVALKVVNGKGETVASWSRANINLWS